MKTDTKILTFSCAEICQHGYSKVDIAHTVCFKNLNTSARQKSVETNSADPDQTASEEAV